MMVEADLSDVWRNSKWDRGILVDKDKKIMVAQTATFIITQG